MSANKELLAFNERILNEIKDLKKLINLMNTDISIIKETSNLTHAKISNLSSKVDLNISTLNICSTDTIVKSPAATSTGLTPKRKPNIMVWSKNKFKTDPELIYDIVGKKNVESLFDKFKKELADKKTGKKDAYDTYRAELVYKELIKKNKDYVEKLKNIKAQEEEGNIIPSKEITENNNPIYKNVKSNDNNSDIEDESIADTADVDADDASSDNYDSE